MVVSGRRRICAVVAVVSVASGTLLGMATSASADTYGSTTVYDALSNPGGLDFDTSG